MFLLQRLRDEAHRFAIRAHRGARSKRMTASVLDDVPGLGPSRRAALTEVFPTVSALRKATIEELCEVPGIGPGVAAAIHSVLGKQAQVTDRAAADVTDSDTRSDEGADDER